MRKLAEVLKKWILWEFPRGSWQYDVMVALILGFVFLTPREWFRDRPKPQHVAMLPAEGGAAVYWIDSRLLAGLPEAERLSRAEAIVRSYSKGAQKRVVRLEPIFDSERELQGFMAFAVP